MLCAILPQWTSQTDANWIWIIKDLQAHDPRSRLCEIYIISALINTLISSFEVHVTHFLQSIKITSHTSAQLCNCSRSSVCVSVCVHFTWQLQDKNSKILTKKKSKLTTSWRNVYQSVSQPTKRSPKIKSRKGGTVLLLTAWPNAGQVIIWKLYHCFVPK